MNPLTAATEKDENVVVNRTPPFWIKSVRLRNYKSVEFCDVALEPMTLLVGRNGVGKSNFLDALAFIGELASRDIRDVINDHGGTDSLLNRTTPCESFEINLRVALGEGENTEPVEVVYQFRYSPRRRTWADRIEENFWLPRSGEMISAHKGVGGFQGDWGEKVWDEAKAFPNPGFSLLTVVRDPICVRFREGLRGLRRYNIQPDALRLRTKRGPATFLKRDASNAATVYRYLKESGSWRYERLLNYLENVVPQLRAVEPSGNEYEDGLEFSWWTGEVTAWPPMPRTGDERIKKFPAVAMSDGTLRAFGVLLAALQTTDAEGDPSVLLLEEPETDLHPAAMRALVAALDEAALRVQVVMSTHSPELLEANEITFAKLRVVDAKGGSTLIGPVDSASVEILRNGLNTLGGLERENQLEPDSEDQDRQQLLKAQLEAEA